MATVNNTPDRVQRSFDRLTTIVCTSDRKTFEAAFKRLIDAGKISRQEGGIVLEARRMYMEGFPQEDDFRIWGMTSAAQMETAPPRLARFLEWADVIAERSYCTAMA